MGLTFRMLLPNAEEFSVSLGRFGVDLEDFLDVWPAVTKAIEQEEAWQFQSRGAAGPHGAWSGLTERYLARKYKKYGAQQIEVARGRLRRALTDSTSGDAIRQYSKLSMQFGTSLPYAIYQQTGWRPSHLGRYGQMGQIVDRMLSNTEPVRTFGRSDFVPPRRPIDPGEQMGISIRRAAMKAIDNKARRAGFARAKFLGLDIGPGTARTFGYGVLTGMFTGEGGS